MLVQHRLAADWPALRQQVATFRGQFAAGVDRPAGLHRRQAGEQRHLLQVGLVGLGAPDQHLGVVQHGQLLDRE